MLRRITQAGVAIALAGGSALAFGLSAPSAVATPHNRGWYVSHFTGDDNWDGRITSDESGYPRNGLGFVRWANGCVAYPTMLQVNFCRQRDLQARAAGKTRTGWPKGVRHIGVHAVLHVGERRPAMHRHNWRPVDRKVANALYWPTPCYESRGKRTNFVICAYGTWTSS